MDQQYCQLLVLTFLRVLFRNENCSCLMTKYQLRCLHRNKTCMPDQMKISENVLQQCMTEEFYTSELARLGYAPDTSAFEFVQKNWNLFFEQLEVACPQQAIDHEYFADILQKQQFKYYLLQLNVPFEV